MYFRYSIPQNICECIYVFFDSVAHAEYRRNIVLTLCFILDFFLQMQVTALRHNSTEADVDSPISMVAVVSENAGAPTLGKLFKNGKIFF